MSSDQTTQVSAHQPHRATAAPLRWFVCVICVLYGFGKLNGSQFTILDSELTKPLGEVSGFWLTWYYFGYSTTYGAIVALTQIAGGVLVAWPRTALAGALLLLPIFANIVLIDVFFGVEPGATVLAVLVLISLVAIVAPHAGRVRAAVMLNAPPRRSAVRLLAIAVIIGASWAFSWWVANYNNRHPTAIDGVWSVIRQTGDEQSPRWHQVFFERNRAFWVTFRTLDGADERHHFEVDDHGVVRIWQTWLTKGALIMQGELTRDGQLELDSVSDRPASQLLLQRSKLR